MNSGKRPLGALLLLCLLWAVSAVRAELMPTLAPAGETALPPFARQALLYLAMAAVAAAWSFVRRKERRSPISWAAARSGLGVSCGLFIFPVVAGHLGGGEISGYARTALMTLVPVFAIVFQPYLCALANPPARFSLLAALAALGGACSVFDVGMPTSHGAALGFVLAILAAAGVAAASCRTFEAAEPITVPASAWAAFAFGAASLLFERRAWPKLGPTTVLDLVLPIAFDLPALILLFWLLRRMSPARAATRYVIAPLFALFIGIAADRPQLELRTILGLILMAAGAGYLLLAAEPPSLDTPPASFLPR